MQHARRSVARRRYRAVRLVASTTPRRRASPIEEMVAPVYAQALAIVRLLRQHFPAFYAKHVADLVITPASLYGAVVAFLSLVQCDLFELEDNFVLDIPSDPLRALRSGDDSDIRRQNPLLILEEACYWLSRPRALLYGIGIEGILEDEQPQQALTLALWRLFSQTAWSIGVDVTSVMEYSYLTPAAVERIAKLRPLPAMSDDAIDALLAAFDLPGEPWSSRIGELIRYAFARTDNPMADVTNYEVDVVYGGEVDDEWTDIQAIATNARAARELVALYDDWAHRVDADPSRELPRLARALHAAAAPYARREPQDRPKTLIELLTPAVEEVAA